MLSSILSGTRAVLVDMDGVVFRGADLLPGVRGFFNFVYEGRIPWLLVTNSARQTPGMYAERLRQKGIVATDDCVLTSAMATAAHLSSSMPAGSRVYAIGEEGLCKPLRDAGFVLTGPDDTAVDAVVVGLDHHFSYDKLRAATRYVRGGAHFYGCNGDPFYPVEDGFAPGAGAILQAIQAASAVVPRIIGKPARTMFDIALSKLGRSAREVVMLGDRLESDIVGAQRVGIPAILVTTGEDSAEDAMQKGIAPDASCANLDELVKAWREGLT